LALHPTGDGLTLGLELVPALALVGFGAWVLIRRVRGRPV
jgi:flagellar biogenesis protein FliO